MNENGSLVSHPDAAQPDEYETDYFGRQASELIESAAPGARPFYLQVRCATGGCSLDRRLGACS